MCAVTVRKARHQQGACRASHAGRPLSATVVSSGAAAAKFGDELVDRSIHRFEQAGHVAVDACEFAAQRCDGSRVQVVLQVEHVVLEACEHRVNAALGTVHGGHEALVTPARCAELAFAVAPKRGARVLVQFGLPFGEQRFGDRLDAVDPVGDFFSGR